MTEVSKTGRVKRIVAKEDRDQCEVYMECRGIETKHGFRPNSQDEFSTWVNILTTAFVHNTIVLYRYDPSDREQRIREITLDLGINQCN